jgi:hypothetical protein
MDEIFVVYNTRCVPVMLYSSTPKADCQWMTRMLGWQVLPRRVAARLAAGEKVEPQACEEATVLFSEIVGVSLAIFLYTLVHMYVCI